MKIIKKTIKKIEFLINLSLQLVIVSLAFMVTRKKRKKIIIGVQETANILFNLKSLFEDECIVVSKNRNRFYPENVYDYEYNNRNIFLLAFLFGRLAKNAKYFIYLFDDSFLLDREIEFGFLKKRYIPIICLFLGSEIRSPRLFLDYCKEKKFNTYIEYLSDWHLSIEFDNIRRKLAEQADKYATIVFSAPEDQMSYLKSVQYYFPPIIDENLFSFDKEKFNTMPLKILHAPSSPIIKATPLVRSTIKMLEKEGYEFQYLELINVSHEYVIRALRQSHIVLNQFYALIPGVFGHEAMATGNAVLMSAKPECQPYLFNNAWIETDDWQLYYNLKYLLDNPQKIIEYAKNGYDYMIANFTRKAIKNHLLPIFKKNGLEF